MKKFWIFGILGVLGFFFLVFLVFALSMVRNYNSLITMSEEVDQAWAQVENQYQRRLDLIP
ncbi:MAG: LemA family protein, partial [bacterium]|nr:LemA family protein [bacterium]